MLFFVPVGKQKCLEIIEKGVLRRPEKPIKVYRKLERAIGKKSMILVMDSKDFVKPEKHDGFYTYPEIPASCFLNLNPHFPPREIIAGGGYVVRKNAAENTTELLLIFRRGKWDLPKGKQDPGEHEIQTALREVREEVGIKYDLTLVQPLGSTQHAYVRDGFLDVKTTYWYEMHTHQQTFEPQKEEDIEKVRWVEWYASAALLGFDTLKKHHQHATQILFPDAKPKPIHIPKPRPQKTDIENPT